MDIGRPVAIEIERCDDGEIAVEMYDEAGFCCGGVSIFPDGTVSASLIAGDNQVIARDVYKPES